MIYGDNPNKINEREDALGLKTYTYAPSISSIMQSGNLYVYGVNNPIAFTDYSGNSITLATIAGKMFLGATINLAVSYLSAKVTGQDFSMTDAIVAVISGAVGGGTNVIVGGILSFFLSGYVNLQKGHLSLKLVLWPSLLVFLRL